MFLADTNIFSECAKLRPEPRVTNWIEANQETIFLSTVTLAEIQAGIMILEEGKKKDSLRLWFDVLRQDYRDSILPFDEAVALRWGELDAELERKGRKVPIEDSSLAATALQHHLTLVTRNEKDFSGTAVKIFNPWKS